MFSKKMVIRNAAHEFQDYIENQDLCVEIWGHQDVQRDPNKAMVNSLLSVNSGKEYYAEIHYIVYAFGSQIPRINKNISIL